MQVQGDGTYNATFRYKIDLPNANSFMYGDGALGSVASSTAAGGWGITFNDDKNITISSPEATTDVVSEEWSPYAGASSILPTGATKSVLIAKSGLPGEDMGFFRLAKRGFTRLQGGVELNGAEVAADLTKPGSPGRSAVFAGASSKATQPPKPVGAGCPAGTIPRERFAGSNVPGRPGARRRPRLRPNCDGLG